MTFLEPIIAAVLGVLLGIGASKLSSLNQIKNAVKYGPLLVKVFDIVDPVLVQYMHKWNDSDIQNSIRLTIQAVSDGKLTPEEINNLVVKVTQLWLPDKAAAKFAAYQKASQTPAALTASRFISAAINGRISNKEAISLIRNSI